MRNHVGFPLCFVLLALFAGTRDVQAVTASAESNVTAVDTRTLTMTQLTVTGASPVTRGADAAFLATLQYQGASAQDVTAECVWSVAGGPTVSDWRNQPAMSGNVLTAQVPSTIPLFVTASVKRDNGRIYSAPFPVIVTDSAGLRVSLIYRYPTDEGPKYVRQAGSNLVWRIVASAGVAGHAANEPGLTFQWSLDGQPLATGPEIDVEVPGLAHEGRLSVLATDSLARTGLEYQWAIFNAPEVVNEPPLRPVSIPAVGQFKREVENGANPIQVEDYAPRAARIPTGLIILTHGIYADVNSVWLHDLARAIRERLNLEGRPLPNIAIYGWGELAKDPSKTHGVDQQRAKAIALAHNILVRAGIAASTWLVNTIADLYLIRPDGQTVGEEVADWIRSEVSNGNIDSSAPIHLIGHSAGGFVVGEAAWLVRYLCDDLRVTMLDTPFTFYNHIWRFPDSGQQLDQYVSSFFGSMQFPTGFAAYLFSDAYSAKTLLSLIPRAGPDQPTTIAHSYSNQWYRDTVAYAQPGEAGFGYSPFFLPSPPAPFAGLDAPLSAPPPPPTETTVPITGFTTFGAATADVSGFILAEGPSQNAGVTRAAYSFPPGTHSLRFAFRFTTPGDGDFLSVSFGDFPPFFTGKDMPLTRDGELTVDVPVEHLAGVLGDLVFRLVSRGQQNAVVTIHDLVAVTVEDADNDGLSNAAEAALGTSAMSADTDGDGLSDAAEVNLHLTSPLRADTDGDGQADGAELAASTDPKNPLSRLAITATAFAPTGFSLQWSSQPVRNYRVLRSTTPGFESYSVVGSVLSNASPTQSFLDPSVVPGAVPAMFYRVELAP